MTEAKVYIAHPSERLPNADGCIIVRTDGEILVPVKNRWKHLRPAKNVSEIHRKELKAGEWTDVQFPQPCFSDRPSILVVGRSKEDWNVTIGVSVSDITRYGFKAYSADEDCTLEFTYGDPKEL